MKKSGILAGGKWYVEGARRYWRPHCYYNLLGVVEFTVYFLLKKLTWSTRAIAEHFVEIMK